MKRSVLFALAGLVLVFSLACSALGGDGGGSSTSGVDIEIDNRSPDEICYVLISPSDSDAWGDDQLGSDERIAPGDSRTFNMDDDTYDVQVENCDQAVMATEWEIADDTTVQVGDSRSTVRLLISNESSTEVCYVFISPSSGDDWGDDWMGANETIQSGQLRLFYVEPDTYDLQAADCDGETLTEEYEVDLTEDLTWTLND